MLHDPAKFKRLARQVVEDPLTVWRGRDCEREMLIDRIALAMEQAALEHATAAYRCAAETARKEPTWVTDDSYGAQVDMRERIAKAIEGEPVWLKSA